jgi:predicted ATPase
MERKSLLVITGSMGAGKSSVLGEASDILTLRSIRYLAEIVPLKKLVVSR